MKRLRRLIPALALAAVSAWAGDMPGASTAANTSPVPTPNPSIVTNADAAAATIPGVKKEDVKPSPVAGVFEVRRGADIVYMSGDGQYVFTGDLYNVPSRSNLTEAHRRVLRQKLIES